MKDYFSFRNVRGFVVFAAISGYLYSIESGEKKSASSIWISLDV
jgi:hypothetical protein